MHAGKATGMLISWAVCSSGSQRTWVCSGISQFIPSFPTCVVVLLSSFGLHLFDLVGTAIKGSEEACQ